MHAAIVADPMPDANAAADTIATDTNAPSADDSEVAGPSNAVPVARPPLLPQSADDGQIIESSGIGMISIRHKTNILYENN